MTWTGFGAFVAWHDVEAGREADYLHWHSHEHMQERVAIPGFRLGRRYSAVDSGPRFLVVYEVADASVFISAAYLERLDNPSAWTRQVMPSLRDMNRSLCRVEASSGSGMGRFMQTLRFSPAPREEASLRTILAAEVRTLAAERGLCAAHLLIADRDISRPPTREASLRGTPDAVADWILLIEGYDGEAVARDRSARLRQAGADRGIVADLYAIEHIVLREPDLAEPAGPR